VVYQLAAQPVKLFTMETMENPYGIVALSSSAKATSFTLAFPAGQVGQVHLIELSTKSTLPSEVGKVQAPVASIIPAHTTKIAALALSDTGEWLATASEKGTLIRIFECKTGKLMHELRRGMDEAHIYSIQFNPLATRIIVSSDKGTIHIFNLPNLSDGESTEDSTPHTPALSKKPSSEQLPPANKHSAFSFLSPLLPKYFASEWSFAHFSITVDSRCMAAFVNGETSQGKQDIIVVCADGSVYKYGLDLKSGDCQQEQYEWLIQH
jgi:WD40 repeat protein